ncbi:MAG: hypothetical protein JWO91_2464 [Acidobacteriaceae bacterium]|nr:hypothetical protein [Acidobacteriaceae bacterium]
MRKALLTMFLVLAVVAGTTLVAKADSQQFNGPNGTQTLTTKIKAGLGIVKYSFSLSGATGSYAGSCAWFSQCKVSAQFTDVVKGVTYIETVTGLWNGRGWSNFNLGYSPVQASEESSFFELLCAALAFLLVLPLATKLRRPVRA